MFQVILEEYKQNIYKGARPLKQIIRIIILLSVWTFFLTVIYVCFTRLIYVLCSLALIPCIQIIIILKSQKMLIPQQYQDSHIQVLIMILQHYHFNHLEWIDYFLNQCEHTRRRHQTNISVISLITLFISIGNFVIACKSFWKADQTDQLIFMILLVTILVIACSMVICLKSNIEYLLFPQKKLVESFEEDLKYLKTLYQTGETKIQPR